MASDLQSDARFVLIVEKDATFQKLLDDGACRKLGPCIIITVRLILLLENITNFYLRCFTVSNIPDY